MCQLTLIEFKDQRLAKLIIRPLTEINTVGISTFANNDGFGYVCFSNLDNIIKTKESAQNWWTDNKTQLLKPNKNINGLYHVRACSPGQPKDQDIHSHPIENKNLIQIHNGTLEIYKHRKENKDLEPLIKFNSTDSANFLNTLEYYVEQNPPLSTKHILKTLDHWNGTYALMIIDKRLKNEIFIIKDDIKTLNSCTFYIQQEPIGIIINTGDFEINYIANIIESFLNLADNIKVTFNIEKIENLTISNYKLGSYTFPQIIEKIPIKVEKIVHNPISFYKSKTHNNYAPLVNLLTKLNISYNELQIISEVCLNKNIFILNDSDIQKLTQLEGLSLDGMVCYKNTWVKRKKTENIQPRSPLI